MASGRAGGRGILPRRPSREGSHSERPSGLYPVGVLGPRSGGYRIFDPGTGPAASSRVRRYQERFHIGTIAELPGRTHLHALSIESEDAGSGLFSGQSRRIGARRVLELERTRRAGSSEHGVAGAERLPLIGGAGGPRRRGPKPGTVPALWRG